MISPADVSPPYFTTGFPYKKDEYLSYAASCWATMALLSGMPAIGRRRRRRPSRSHCPSIRRA